MMAGRPSESVVTNRAKRQHLLDRYEALVAEGMRCHEAARAVGFQHTTINRWVKERTEEQLKSIEAQRMTLSGGSFASALERLRAGMTVRRSGASWFLQLVEGKICLYLIDGGGNRRYSRVASFGSADVLAMDWELYAG
jgi:hypothetical protein